MLDRFNPEVDPVAEYDLAFPFGDFRPAKKGPYGRFRVDAWQAIA